MSMDFGDSQEIIESMIANLVKLFYVASDLRNNLEHANLTQNTYFAIPRPQINES